MAKQTRRGAVARYVRSYHLAPPYRGHDSVVVEAPDGTPLVVQQVGGPADATATVVVLHGFVHWSRTPPVHRFAHELAKRFAVVVPDLRGHGRSGGTCTFGRLEAADLRAVIAATCAPDRGVVTVGVSLGAAVALLHAAEEGEVDGVVAVSPPATWGGVATEGAARIERWTSDPARRRVLAALLRTRVDATRAEVPSAADIAPRIRASFVILAADPGDWYFGPEHAQQLYDAITVDKELWWLPGAGHGSDILTRGFAARVSDAVAARLPAGRPPRRPAPWR